jgi:hypothetical protein
MAEFVESEAIILNFLMAMAISVQDWSPHMSFILKGSQISALMFKSWFKFKTSIQGYRNEIQNSYRTCACIIWYMFPVQCEDLRINHPTLILVLTMPYTCWFLCRAEYIENFKLTSSFSMWGCVLKGNFERRIFWKAKSYLKGVEDFNLEHWWLWSRIANDFLSHYQSDTLLKVLRP